MLLINVASLWLKYICKANRYVISHSSFSHEKDRGGIEEKSIDL